MNNGICRMAGNAEATILVRYRSFQITAIHLEVGSCRFQLSAADRQMIYSYLDKW